MRSAACGNGYDGANRPLIKSYSDATPAVTYSHSGERLMSASNSVGSIGYGYDELNRVMQRTITFAGATNPTVIGYGYVPAGVQAITYPSGRVVQYDYDDAGRAKAVTSVSGAYVSQASYVSHGGLAQMTYGNSLVEKRGYNAVMQPVSITVGTTASVVDRLSLQLSYCSTSGTRCLVRRCGSRGRSEMRRLEARTQGKVRWSKSDHGSKHRSGCLRAGMKRRRVTDVKQFKS